MKKLLTFAFAVASIATLLPEAGAITPMPSAPVTQSGPTVLPGSVLEAPVIIVEGRRRHYRYVQRPYYYHGRRRYRSVRVFID